MRNRAYQIYLKQKAETYKKGFEFKRKLEEEYYQANITSFETEWKTELKKEALMGLQEIKKVENE